MLCGAAPAGNGGDFPCAGCLLYETIVKAHDGDSEAMNEALANYNGYIRYCSHIQGHFNVDMEDYIKTKLIESQFKFSFDS